MQRLKFVSMGASCLFLATSLIAFSGCDDSGTEVKPTEADKKVDQGVQNGMKDFMQQKSQPKAKTK